MNKPVLFMFLAPVVVIIAGLRLHGLTNPASAEGEDASAPAKTESVYTGGAVMSREAFLKLGALRGKVAATPGHALTDAEVDWLIQTRNGGSKTKPYAASIARARPLEVLLQANLTPAQKEKVYQAVVPDFTSRDKWGAAGDRLRACEAVEVLHETRAAPHLQTLLRHNDARVRTRAKRALNALVKPSP